MRKIPFIFMALTAMTSCGNTYTAKHVELSNEIDSLNYALGFVNGAQIKMYYLQNDSSSATINEFMDALTDAYNKKSGEKSEAERIGANIGASARQFEENGLAEREEWAYNGKMFMQGIVNGLYNDTTVNFGGNTGEWFQAKYANAQADSTEQAKTIKAECPSKPKKVTLKTLNDSLNYALGYLNGEQISMRLLTEDKADAQKKAFINALNASMKYRNPQLAQMGEQIGQAIATQEESGLLGVEGVETVFELISQGFVNGLSGYEGQMTMMEAGEYVSTTLDRLRYGDVKAEGERFLEENKMKEGVITTESGLQYEILTQGTGKKPEATDRVKVHYHGTLIDGTVFDSSVERGEPITFGLNQVIAGWTEGVQLMPVGSKYRFYIPQELGYGSRAAGQIPPYSTLIFEVELLGIE